MKKGYINFRDPGTQQEEVAEVPTEQVETSEESTDANAEGAEA